MPSFDAINYSLRPSKSIQRQLVFDGVRELQGHLNLEDPVYIGFGSVWFTDFVMAHKNLGIDDMVSIESNDVGYSRAMFNSPYATVRVVNGTSNDVLPTLFKDEHYQNRSWVVWLDYDYGFDESVKKDISLLVEEAPENSIVLITFNGSEMKYGQPPNRPDRLRDLFGNLVPDELSKRACKKERIQDTLADFALQYMESTASNVSRPGGFLPAFRIIYRDSAPMVTVGGVLPKKSAGSSAIDVTRKRTWSCFLKHERVNAPLLTIREATSLQSKLPREEMLSRDDILKLGFDLEETQIETFQRYYKYYPSFAQILT